MKRNLQCIQNIKYSKYLLIMKNCLMNDNIYICNKVPLTTYQMKEKLLHLSTTNPI